MKIWMPTIATGTGAEVYNRMLAAGLAKRGHEVSMPIAPHSTQYCPWLSGLKPPPGVDVTIANSWNAAVFVKPAPLVTVVHHVVHDLALRPYKSFWQTSFHAAFVKPMELAAIRASAAVVAVSDTTRRAVAKFLGHDSATTVLNGVDTDYFTPAPRSVPGGPIKLLFVGKPSRRKGFDLIAQLTSRMGPSAKLTVIGGDPEYGLIMPEGDYRGRVSQEELRQAYRTADFLILPSRVEGFGYAAAEAMACGTPVLCASTGAVAEIAQIGKAAIAVEANALDSTVAAILKLRNDAVDYAAMRNMARNIASTQLDQTRWLDQMEAVLTRVAMQ